MAVQYKVVSKRPGGMAGERKPKYYASVTKTKIIGTRELAKICHERNVCNRSTFLAVADMLSSLIPDLLKDGRSVKLGELGIFSLSIKGEGYDNPDHVDKRSIKSVNINFRPSTEVKDLMTTTKFEKAVEQ